jgi:ferredoxin
MARELRVDWIRCEGFGLCGDLAPDLIGLDEWRYPIIDPSVAADSRLSDALLAIDCCPMRALSLVDAGTGSRHLRVPPKPAG